MQHAWRLASGFIGLFNGNRWLVLVARGNPHLASIRPL